MPVCTVSTAPLVSPCLSPLPPLVPHVPGQFCFYFHVIYTWILYTCVMSRNYTGENTCRICVPEMDVIHLSDNLQVYDFHCVCGPRFLLPFFCCGIPVGSTTWLLWTVCSGHWCAKMWHTMQWTDFEIFGGVPRSWAWLNCAPTVHPDNILKKEIRGPTPLVIASKDKTKQKTHKRKNPTWNKPKEMKDFLIV